MTKPPTGRSPSKEEFHLVIDTEFAFLAEDGYEKSIKDEYHLEFTNGLNRLRVIGAGYGLAVDIDFYLNGQPFPYWSLAPEGKIQRKTPKTDSPQLDGIREVAWWFRNEFRGLLQGRPEVLEKAIGIREELKRLEEAKKKARLEDKQGMFFSVADKLFKAEKYAECVKHLESGEFPLSSSWKTRLDYAKKKL